MPKKGRKATRTTPGFTGPFKGASQQGTLFDKGTTPKTGDEIGPRGYSLNRSRQFQSVLGSTPLDSYNWSTPTRHTNTPMLDTESGETYALHPHAGARGHSKLIDTLARSTVPPEHLEGLREIHVGRKPAGQPGLQGNYTPAESKIRLFGQDADTDTGMWGLAAKGQPQQRGPVSHDAEQTLIHEIGHHVSKGRGTNSYRTDEEQAAEEGRADKYGIEHFRQDPRGVAWQGRHDPVQHTYGARGNVPGQKNKEYNETLGAQHRAPQSHGPHHMFFQAERERYKRPMLDEYGGRGRSPGDVFTNTLSEKAHEGWAVMAVPKSLSSPEWSGPVRTPTGTEEEKSRRAQYAIASRGKGKERSNVRDQKLKAKWGAGQHLNNEQFGGGL